MEIKWLRGVDVKFSTLFNKLGKQPIKNTQSADVIAVFYVDDLRKLVAECRANYANTVSIPLNLKFGNGKQKMWFVRREEKNNERRMYRKSIGQGKDD